MARQSKAAATAADDPTEPRRPLYAELTPTAYEAWNDFAGRYGLSVTAVLEAIGHELVNSEEWHHSEISAFPAPVRAVLEHARVIGQERRRRKR